jgi:hypothetical protein
MIDHKHEYDVEEGNSDDSYGCRHCAHAKLEAERRAGGKKTRQEREASLKNQANVEKDRKSDR